MTHELRAGCCRRRPEEGQIRDFFGDNPPTDVIVTDKKSTRGFFAHVRAKAPIPSRRSPFSPVSMKEQMRPKLMKTEVCIY